MILHRVILHPPEVCTCGYDKVHLVKLVALEKRAVEGKTREASGGVPGTGEGNRPSNSHTRVSNKVGRKALSSHESGLPVGSGVALLCGFYRRGAGCVPCGWNIYKKNSFFFFWAAKDTDQISATLIVNQRHASWLSRPQCSPGCGCDLPEKIYFQR